MADEDCEQEAGEDAEEPALSTTTTTTTPSPSAPVRDKYGAPVRDKYGRFKKAARVGKGGKKISQPHLHFNRTTTEQVERDENDETMEEQGEEDESTTDEDCEGTSALPQKVVAPGDAADSEPNEPWDPPTIVDGTTVEFALDPVRRQLTCILCGGCYRDPLTTTKCLHTFCRSCLYVAFSRGHYDCPSCDTYLGQDPTKCALPDGALRTLIDKVLFPDVIARDRRREEDFYARLGISRKPPVALLGATVSGGLAVGGLDRSNTPRKKRPLDEEEDMDEPSPTEAPDGGDADVDGDRPGAGATTVTTAAAAPVTEPVTFRLIPSLEPREGRPALPPLTHPFLKTDGSIRIGQVKKYVGMKLALLPSNVGETDGTTTTVGVPAEPALEILCQNVPLGNELSVQFARRALWSPSPSSRDDAGGASDPPGLITFTFRLAKPTTSTTAPSPTVLHRSEQET